MSNGTDVIGAYSACRAGLRDEREWKAEEETAKAHFEQAQKQFEQAQKQLEDAGDKGVPAEDYMQALKAADRENYKGEQASNRAQQHRKDAFEHFGEFRAKLGHRRDGMEFGGPLCKPMSDAVADGFKDVAKGVTDAVRGFVKGMGRFVP